MLRHYFHVYADGYWHEPVSEHLDALAASGLKTHLTVGVVGEPANRRAVRIALRFAGVTRWIEADAGWEQVTLRALRHDLAGHDDPVLYAHTKGAANPSELNTAWRRSMTRHVVGDWQHCLDLLDEVDAVGCHWLPPQDGASPFFAGNYWWANADYLRRLPALDTTSRWRAEDWIGIGQPRVHDLLPGWPELRLFGMNESQYSV